MNWTMEALQPFSNQYVSTILFVYIRLKPLIIIVIFSFNSLKKLKVNQLFKTAPKYTQLLL